MTQVTVTFESPLGSQNKTRMLNWLTTHVGPSSSDQSTGWRKVKSYTMDYLETTTYVIEFSDPRDAMLFKLTFG